ncbi:MAG: DNA adenine methylase [Dysgonomonas sp.]
MKENPEYLSSQIITYLGNKRKLLPYIETEIINIKKKLDKEKLNCVDLFTGSGIVARMMKQYSDNLYVNDIETYSKVINECYLTNKSEFDIERYNIYYNQIINKLNVFVKDDGTVYTHYAPQDDNNIEKGERCFYTSFNAQIIDTIRDEINNIPAEYQCYFLAPLLYEASVHVNTAGTFKGFYKSSKSGIGKFGGDGENSLSRIMDKIELKKPIFSNYECNTFIYKEDANILINQLPKVDLIYIDCPYNQHSYSSNYHLLNTICNNRLDSDISNISGIPVQKHKSNYNNRNKIFETFNNLISQANAEYLIISYNSEGFIDYQDMINLLSNYGKIKVRKIEYPTYRGSRNLNGRAKTVTEYLFILHKDRDLAELLNIKRQLETVN